MQGTVTGKRKRVLRGAIWVLPALWLVCDLLIPSLRPMWATARLHRAVQNGDTPGVRRALADGASPYAPVSDDVVGVEVNRGWRNISVGLRGEIPLLTSAAAWCDGEAVRAVLARLSAPDPYRLPPSEPALTDALQSAATFGNTSAMTALLEAGAARTWPDRNAVLRTAVAKGHVEAARLLLARGFRLIPLPSDDPARLLASRNAAERLVARATWPGRKATPGASEKTAPPSSPAHRPTRREDEAAAVASRRRQQEARAAAEAVQAGWDPLPPPSSLR